MPNRRTSQSEIEDIVHCKYKGSGSLCRVRIFISNLLRATIFIFIQLQQRPFILRYSLFESDGCRIIYLIFLGTQAMIFILRCLTAKIFILKNCQPSPLPPESTVRPLKKGTKFNHSQIVPTAMLHGLWPSWSPKINSCKYITYSMVKF